MGETASVQDELDEIMSVLARKIGGNGLLDHTATDRNARLVLAEFRRDPMALAREIVRLRLAAARGEG